MKIDKLVESMLLLDQYSDDCGYGGGHDYGDGGGDSHENGGDGKLIVD